MKTYEEQLLYAVHPQGVSIRKEASEHFGQQQQQLLQINLDHHTQHHLHHQIQENRSKVNPKINPRNPTSNSGKRGRTPTAATAGACVCEREPVAGASVCGCR